MNNIKLIIFVFIFIIIFCFVGAFFVQADTEIRQEKDILEIHNNITDNINVYGYNIDNPNVIVNPYNVNYNSALIMFETDDYVSVKVNVNDIYTYNTKDTNRHYIGVYNLLNGKNSITLSYGNINKKIEINIEESDGNNNLEEGILLSNNHFIVPIDKYIDNGSYTGIREVDIFGKIYYEYLIDNGYNGLACEIDEEKLAVLSDKLIILDRQNGNIISSFDISSYKEDWYAIDYVNNMLVLYSETINIAIDVDGDISFYEGEYEKKYLSGDVNYNNVKGIRFYDEIKTNKSDINVWLLNYDEMENEIGIKKEFNRIVISSEEISDCNTYLILDQLLDKRVYELCNNVNYIYTYDMDGKYSIYFKIEDNIYKTNKYLKF